MSARIIDGKAHAAALRARVAEEVRRLRQAGIAPGLAVVLVGDDPASSVYVGSKGRACREAGIASFEHRLAETTDPGELLNLVEALNADPEVHGILVQLPLPAQIDPWLVIEAIDPAKDVDGFHPVNVGRLAAGRPGLVPCTPLGALMLLRAELDDLAGAEAVVVGRSNIVGKPMAQLLLAADCTVTIAHSRTRDLPSVVGRADIVIAAVGRDSFVRGDWLKGGSTVIDVGINRRADGTLAGDVDFAAAAQRVRAITPVPGGVGPMTIACLLANTVSAACRQHGLTEPHWLL